jgi:type I restriction enzyme S subunit
MNPVQLVAHFGRVSNALGAVPRLRNFILELAIRGKLTDQDPGDEPILTRMKTNSTPGSTKQTTELLAGQNIPFQIPPNWMWVRLGDICTKTGSGSTPRGGKSVYQRSGVPFLRSQNVYNDGLRLDDVAYITHQTHEKMSGTALQPGDLLLNITGGSIGRCCPVPRKLGQANVSQHVAIIRVAIDGLQNYLHSLILSPYFQRFVLEQQTGAGRGGLPKNRMDRIPVPLPPQAEQDRIVLKVGELMRLCNRFEAVIIARDQIRDRLVAASLQRLNESADDNTVFRQNTGFTLGHLPRLSTRPNHIEMLRQTILNLGVRGRLVRQNTNDEPAAQLLKRLAAEKAHLVKEKRIRQQKPLPTIQKEDEPFAIPNSWEWCRLGDICFVITDGAHHTPKYEPGGIPFLSVKDVSSGIIDFSHTRYISESAHRELSKRCNPERGDILLTKVGTTGIAVTVEDDREFSIFVSLALLKVSGLSLNRHYLRLLINSPFVKQQSAANTQGIGNKNLVLRLINLFTIPIPPIAEQERIVAKVNQLMALCDKLDQQLRTAETESGRLLEAVLGEALNNNQEFDDRLKASDG